MRTEIYIDGYQLDLTKNISAEFTYAIDEIQDFATRNTSFSKTIVLPGNDNNNKLFGNVFEFGISNDYNSAQPNVGYNFNATKSVPCVILVDKIQIFKGVLRLLEIIIDGKSIEYEVAVFGELGGFITALGNKKLEDIDFGIADIAWTATNIANSWDNISGSGVYFPLIDYGQESTNKIDFSFDAFRPALYVKQYLTNILDWSGYTYDFPLLSTALMNRLVIPNNQKGITKSTATALYATAKINNYTSASGNVEFNIVTAGNFTITGSGSDFAYNSATALSGSVQLNISGTINTISPSSDFTIQLRKNGTPISVVTYTLPGDGYNFNAILNVASITLVNTDTLDVDLIGNFSDLDIEQGLFIITSSNPTDTTVNYGEDIVINDTIPKGIFQKDFFASIVKMFNLYVYEDKLVEKKLIIKPFIDFYDGSQIDWTGKVDRSSVIRLKPMSEFTARYYDYKYKPDNDFYAENYRKKYNEGYGDFIYDSENEFVKEVDATELIFAGTTLYQETGTDKIYSAIYKKSNENTKEDKMDSVIRILQAKKITGRNTWAIKNGATTLASYTAYGYAGHVNDPFNPTDDINWGAPRELFFNASSYTTANLFNGYWSEYIAEITDKDSKLLTCSVKLNEVDIYNLDFSKLIYIDGSLWRLNKVLDYNPMDFNTTKVELLKVIELTYV
ncbi:hypothetical protein UFOVP321_12 [uncultured Caudovirales phage]|uniref:Uncharacterized protein n=1 Tax=uncultured Caudovirales phage TaxID=2100421 RepID=A0A6J5LW85_9CAUD|nr:hypothetical protein UFOVP321_12 [uncultured Caudovirales phage]